MKKSETMKERGAPVLFEEDLCQVKGQAKNLSRQLGFFLPISVMKETENRVLDRYQQVPESPGKRSQQIFAGKYPVPHWSSLPAQECDLQITTNYYWYEMKNRVSKWYYQVRRVRQVQATKLENR